MLSGRLAQLSLSLAQLSPSLFYLISLVQCLGLKLQCGQHNRATLFYLIHLVQCLGLKLQCVQHNRATLFYHISLVQCLVFQLQCVQHNSIHFVLSYFTGSMPCFKATVCPAQQQPICFQTLSPVKNCFSVKKKKKNNPHLISHRYYQKDKNAALHKF